jgi:exopolyphosphatase/guanosine-5'-triphosphate,3'-diphosphate pyrophosphatase
MDLGGGSMELILAKNLQVSWYTSEERHEIACIARYHRRALPSEDHKEFAILSAAARNATTWTISLWVSHSTELAQEEMADEKADLFKREFKRKLHFIIRP